MVNYNNQYYKLTEALELQSLKIKGRNVVINKISRRLELKFCKTRETKITRSPILKH